jgi:dolichol-phosphate mannosyltransferase
MKTLVVLPSFNERENIVELMEAILKGGDDRSVCVVDDSSPDGTSEHVARAIAERPHWKDRAELITRSKKDGRGGAVREGFARAVAAGKQFEAYVEMDCDFSHEPSAIDEGLALLDQGLDVVIGARYPSGTIIGWPASRRVFSFFANTLARAAIEWRVADYTNGFRFYSPEAVEVLLAHEQRHKGYIYLSESLAHLLAAGMKVGAFPIVFRNRERGVSNTSLREIRSALTGIVSIALRYRLPR